MSETKTTKLCTGCFERQPFENFYSRRAMGGASSYMSKCKDCCSRKAKLRAQRKKKEKKQDIYMDIDRHTWMNGDVEIYL